MSLIRSVLKIVGSCTRDAFLHVLINFVCLSVHVNFWTITDRGSNCVTASSRQFVMALQNHTWALFGAYAPSRGLIFYLGHVGIILSRRCLEHLLLLKGQVFTNRSSNLPGGLLLLDRGRTVVTWTWLLGLLLCVRLVLEFVAHRES